MINKVKNRICDFVRRFREEMPAWEYALWWLVRVWLIIATIRDFTAHAEDGHYNLQMISNLLLTFALPLVSFVCGKKTFFGRLPLSANTVAVVMVFVTCVLGLHYRMYELYYWFDTAVHFIAGGVVVLLGISVMKALGQKNAAPVVYSACGFGLSCFASVFWEIYEFTFDNITGHDTQGWGCTPSPVLEKLLPDADPTRYALFDTMTDIVFGLAGAILGGIAVRLVLERKEKKALRG